MSYSTWNTYGSMAGTAHDTFGAHDSAHQMPVHYGGAVQSAWYSYQAGLAGFGEDPYFGDPEMDGFFDFLKRDPDKVAARKAAREKRKSERLTKRTARKEKRAQRKLDKRGRQYRIIRLDDGVVLKQDGNNVYTIMKLGTRKSFLRHGAHKVGEKLKPGSHHYSEVHNAVLADHGPFSPGATAQDWMKLATVGGGIGLEFAKIFKGGAPEDRLPDVPTGPVAPMSQPGIPKQYLYIGGGVLGLVLLVALLKK